MTCKAHTRASFHEKNSTTQCWEKRVAALRVALENCQRSRALLPFFMHDIRNQRNPYLACLYSQRGLTDKIGARFCVALLILVDSTPSVMRPRLDPGGGQLGQLKYDNQNITEFDGQVSLLKNAV